MLACHSPCSVCVTDWPTPYWLKWNFPACDLVFLIEIPWCRSSFECKSNGTSNDRYTLSFFLSFFTLGDTRKFLAGMLSTLYFSKTVCLPFLLEPNTIFLAIKSSIFQAWELQKVILLTLLWWRGRRCGHLLCNSIVSLYVQCYFCLWLWTRIRCHRIFWCGSQSSPVMIALLIQI